MLIIILMAFRYNIQVGRLLIGGQNEIYKDPLDEKLRVGKDTNRETILIQCDKSLKSRHV